MTAPDLSADPNAVRVRKRETSVLVTFARDDGTCRTLEGLVRYHAGDAILSGVESERWPITRDQFMKRYRPLSPTRKGEDGTYVSLPGEARAVQLRCPSRVLVGQGGALWGDAGDWLIEYEHGGYGIVQRSIFSSTYDILEHLPAGS